MNINWSRIVAIVILLLVIAPAVGQAQAGGDWSRPGLLYAPQEDEGVRANPSTSLVADQMGAAHLVWLSRLESSSGDESYLYYYSRWDGKHWTEPVDIVASSPDLSLGSPTLVPAPDGKLHLFWGAWEGVIHSWAWATDAGSARAWAPPEATAALEVPIWGQIDVKLDSFGVFHVVYATRSGELCYVRSEDEARTWSQPTTVTTVPTGMTAYLPKLDVGGDARIHVVWTELYLEQGPENSTGVYYARTIDGGNTWTPSLQLGRHAHSDGNVMATGDMVYLAWNAGVGTTTSRGRMFQYSTDRGTTWLGPVQIGSTVGQSSYPSIALDTKGTVHILTGEGQYASWDGYMMSIQELTPDPEIQTERSRLVVVSGNQLVAIFPPDDLKVYFATRQLDAPAIPTVVPARPTRLALDPTPSSVPTVMVMEDRSKVADELFNTEEGFSDASSAAPAILPVLVSAVLVTCLTGAVILINQRGRSV